MKNKLLILTLVIWALWFSEAVAFAYPQVLGKRDARGQIKNELVDVTVGKVEDVKPNKIEVRTREGKTEINTHQNTKILEKPSGRKLDIGQLKKDDWVATIATASAQATLSAKLVLVKSATESAALKKRRAVYGLVRSISGNILVVSHPTLDNPRYTIQLVDATFIKIKGLEQATVGDIRVGDRIAAVGNWQDEVLAAKRIHVIPGGAIGLMERIGTRSATPSATATPSASP